MFHSPLTSPLNISFVSKINITNIKIWKLNEVMNTKSVVQILKIILLIKLKIYIVIAYSLQLMSCYCFFLIDCYRIMPKECNKKREGKSLAFVYKDYVNYRSTQQTSCSIRSSSIIVECYSITHLLIVYS